MTSASRDLDFTCDFRLILEETKGEDACGSIVLWFDTDFSERVCPDMPVVLTTSPCSEPTHWAQTVLPLSTPIGATKAEAIAGRVSFAARKDAHRSLDIAVECWAELKGGGKGDAQSAIYNMGVNQDP